MLKSALGVAVSLMALWVGMPTASASGASGASSKQTTQKKAAAKKPASTRKTARATSSKTATPAQRKQSADKQVVAGGKRRAVRQRLAQSAPVAAAVPTAGDLAGLHATPDPLALASNVALVVDQTNSQVLFEKNADVPLPIASLTKLMTALVVLEAGQDMDEVLEVTADDIDREKNTGSRLRVGSQLSRNDMLHIALMSSENRAASALGRNYPGGLPAFVAAMNAKAKALGMHHTRYVDSTGLSSRNVASAQDLAKLVVAAHKHPLIRDYSTDPKYAVDTGNHVLQYINSNRLVNKSEWEIGLQKTGYISEAGRCLVMQANIEGRPVVMVFLDSKGKMSRIADAVRIRKWLENTKPAGIVHASAHQS